MRKLNRKLDKIENKIQSTKGNRTKKKEIFFLQLKGTKIVENNYYVDQEKLRNNK